MSRRRQCGLRAALGLLLAAQPARLPLALLALEGSQPGRHRSVPEPLMRQQGLPGWFGLGLRLALLLLALVAGLLAGLERLEGHQWFLAWWLE